jgi:hypothetical protein
MNGYVSGSIDRVAESIDRLAAAIMFSAILDNSGSDVKIDTEKLFDVLLQTVRGDIDGLRRNGS